MKKLNSERKRKKDIILSEWRKVKTTADFC